MKAIKASNGINDRIMEHVGLCFVGEVYEGHGFTSGNNLNLPAVAAFSLPYSGDFWHGSARAGRLNTFCRWAITCSASSFESQLSVLPANPKSPSESSLSSRCRLFCANTGIHSPSCALASGSTLSTLNPLLVSPGRQTQPPSVKVQPASLNASASFPANSLTTFIEALRSGAGILPVSSTVRYTRLKVAGLTSIFSQNAVSVIVRSAALDMSISRAVIISIGSIISIYRKEFYPKREYNLYIMGRHSNHNGLLSPQTLQNRRQKNGAEVLDIPQRPYTDQLTGVSA